MDQKKILDDIYEDLSALNFRGSLCAFTIIIKDLAEYLNIHALGSEADALFLSAYNGSLDYHRGYWSRDGFGGKIFDPISMMGWPFGFAKHASAGNYDLKKLFDATANDPCIENEQLLENPSEKRSSSITDCRYYAYLGWDVLRRLEPELGPIAYDIDSPSTDVVMATTRLLAQKLKNDTYWYSFAVLYCMIYLQSKKNI